MNLTAILLGKILIYFTEHFNLGSGSTWPGHIALKLNANFNRDVLSKSSTKVIVVAGTNGKTTTGRLVTSIIRENNNSFLQNKAGANLLNGLASTLIRGANMDGKLDKDYLVFESDENALPKVLEQIDPDYVICLNLFRDQLDRYGEIDSIAKKWRSSFEKLSNKTTLILNADDPQIAYLAKDSKTKSLHFGLEDSKNNKTETKHGADSTYCPKCFEKLEYKSVYFSHLGDWQCPNCKLKRPKADINKLPSYPLTGTYNEYNALASALFAKSDGIKEKIVSKAFENFTPAFGRQEKLSYKGRNVQIFLSKNPTSFNESLQAIKETGGRDLLILLNDRIPDGLDVSWIWDINFEEIIEKDMNIGVSGDRTYDMALRLKYAEIFTHVDSDIETTLDKMVESLEENETLHILPNYSAMLDVRKILTGKKLL